MSRQDKATSEKHTKALRELVKRPENKVCADCKRNDPRWASWNIGVFLCIRCSGIHRGMGTHISKIKSVDLDIWTPEQMESINKWGNGRANLYWEAHLKPGHIPAEHKMESFIRSKYESRRWALEGPPPNDPSVLEGHREHNSEPALPSPPQSRSTSTHQPQPTSSTQRQSQKSLPPKAQPTAANVAQTKLAPAPTPQDDLFSLDFHAPTSSAPTSSGEQKKDVKNDILSLFASSPSPGTGVLAGGGFGAAQAQALGQPSMMGGTGAGVWGVQPGWNGMQTGQPMQGNAWGQQPPANQQGVWGQQQQQQQPPFGTIPTPGQHPQSAGLFATQSIWGGGAAPTAGGAGSDLFNAPAAPQRARNDDAFGDLWGKFK